MGTPWEDEFIHSFSVRDGGYILGSRISTLWVDEFVPEYEFVHYSREKAPPIWVIFQGSVDSNKQTNYIEDRQKKSVIKEKLEQFWIST